MYRLCATFLVFTLFLSLFSLASCKNISKYTYIEMQDSIKTPEAGFGRVFFFVGKGKARKGSFWTPRVNGQGVGPLSEGTFNYIDLPPGQYRIDACIGKSFCKVTVNPKTIEIHSKETVYIELLCWKAHGFSGKIPLLIHPEELALQSLGQCRQREP